MFNVKTQMWDWPFTVEPVFAWESLTHDEELRLHMIKENTHSRYQYLVHMFGE